MRAREFEGIAWYHDWEIFKGVRTPGRRSVSLVCAKARIPRDLSGKRVLDIGAWHGCFSFECERRGASEVVAYSLENPDATGFRRLKALLGSRVNYVQGSVYGLSPQEIGEFDLILFFGVLYHLRYPLLGIDRIRTVSRGDVLIETHTVTSRHLLRAPLWALGAALNLVRRVPDDPDLAAVQGVRTAAGGPEQLVRTEPGRGHRILRDGGLSRRSISTPGITVPARRSARPQCRCRPASPTRPMRASRACTGISPASIARTSIIIAAIPDPSV